MEVITLSDMEVKMGRLKEKKKKKRKIVITAEYFISVLCHGQPFDLDPF